MIESHLEDGRQNEPEVLVSPSRIHVRMGKYRSTCSRNLPNARRSKMTFIEKGQEIDIEAIKAATQLSPEALANKRSP